MNSYRFFLQVNEFFSEYFYVLMLLIIPAVIYGGYRLSRYLLKEENRVQRRYFLIFYTFVSLYYISQFAAYEFLHKALKAQYAKNYQTATRYLYYSNYAFYIKHAYKKILFINQIFGSDIRDDIIEKNAIYLSHVIIAHNAIMQYKYQKALNILNNLDKKEKDDQEEEKITYTNSRHYLKALAYYKLGKYDKAYNAISNIKNYVQIRHYKLYFTLSLLLDKPISQDRTKDYYHKIASLKAQLLHYNLEHNQSTPIQIHDYKNLYSQHISQKEYDALDILLKGRQ